MIDPESARRLGCDCRLETVVHDASGVIVGVGRASLATCPRPLLRALRARDRGCTFPGCGARWFLHAHHIRWWGRGGRTDLDNLVLACHFDHKLVHEHGWDVRLGAPGTAHWLRPNGTEWIRAQLPGRSFQSARLPLRSRPASPTASRRSLSCKASL